MKVRAIYLSDEDWAKLMAIAVQMDKDGKEVSGPQGNLSKSATIRQLIKDYDLPAQPKKGIPNVK